jgi:hypothetical protein
MATGASRPPVPQQAIQFAGGEDARVFFSGPPQALTGNIPLINRGVEKQKLRSLAVSSERLQGVASLPLEEIPFYAKLYPGQQANVRSMIVLDSTTPPGSYEFQMTVGDRTVPATVQVAEVVDLRVTPASLTILAGGPKSYKRQFVAENAGNVDLLTGAQCEAPIFDSSDLVTGLLVGLRKADKTSVEAMVKGFLDEWAEIEAGTLIVKRPAIVIHPGEKLTVEVEFVLPDSLKPLRHYHANLQLYNANLGVDIYTTARAGTAKAGTQKAGRADPTRSETSRPYGRAE